MATTEIAATDGKIFMKDTTEQNKTDSQDEHRKSIKFLFCSVVPFMIVAAVSVVAIMVSIDKNSNHSKTNIHNTTQLSPLILTHLKQCAGGALRLGEGKPIFIHPSMLFTVIENRNHKYFICVQIQNH